MEGLAADCKVGPTALGNAGGVPVPLFSESVTDAENVLADCQKVQTTKRSPVCGLFAKGIWQLDAEHVVKFFADCCCTMVAQAGRARSRTREGRARFTYHLKAASVGSAPFVHFKMKEHAATLRESRPSVNNQSYALRGIGALRSRTGRTN